MIPLLTYRIMNSKTSLMDPRFAPAWIAFAHTFALEGEHDHAVTAYSTCARMFTGSVYLVLLHPPPLTRNSDLTCL